MLKNDNHNKLKKAPSTVIINTTANINNFLINVKLFYHFQITFSYDFVRKSYDFIEKVIGKYFFNPLI